MATPTEPKRFWRKPLDHNTIPRITGVVHIVAERCKGCAYCVEYCPVDVLKLSDDFNLKGYHPPVLTGKTDCVACRLCEVMCPEFAIFISDVDNKAADTAQEEAV